MDFENRNAPRVYSLFIQFNKVGMIRQAFTETVKIKIPRTGSLQLLFEIRSETRHIHAACPSLSPPSSLETVSANKGWMFLLYVAKSGDINSVGTISQSRAIFIARNPSSRSAAHAMIHQVVS